MGITLKKKPAAEISKQLKDHGKVIGEESAHENPDLGAKAETQGVQTPWCQVGVDMSYTHNLGDFKSCKVGVSLVIPCEHAEIDQVFTIGQTWVDERLQSMMAELPEAE